MSLREIRGVKGEIASLWIMFCNDIRRQLVQFPFWKEQFWRLEKRKLKSVELWKSWWNWSIHYIMLNDLWTPKLPLKTLPHRCRYVDIIEWIKLKISPFCHFCDQKREVNAILIYCIWLMCFQLVLLKFLKAENRITCNLVIHQNNIKFSFPITKAIKWWNFQLDSFNSTKY